VQIEIEEFAAQSKQALGTNSFNSNLPSDQACNVVFHVRVSLDYFCEANQIFAKVGLGS